MVFLDLRLEAHPDLQALDFAADISAIAFVEIDDLAENCRRSKQPPSDWQNSWERSGLALMVEIHRQKGDVIGPVDVTKAGR